ncbi:hypothetical protein ANOM_000426 [Aspergillus nomiae NRRL 13137]|uniref:Uncharacterized protein n=1 Tax=Aspergillus nomiae NRRL (strain ATCC 15546 / NRRL 13137 / CBS 260.88 / M93) TaxID=1509407 RepID=A0A0L1JHZ8_ASPN3|nr:uncharacterized protein ANOM_000426 [Aspergillus nomiae NRRL 13137]KNG91386.1 hypothetical protein ANOM_000426 [Aspergillus nomiae NRRL 13137]
MTADARNDQVLKKRISGRPKCGPRLAARDSSSEKQSVGFICFERNATTAALAKRMEFPKRKLGTFYAREFPRFLEPIVPHSEAAFAEDMSTGIRKSFSSIRKGYQYSTGFSGLEGCTILYIISRKGVYAVHWFENVSFSPDSVWLEGTTVEDLFQNTVIDMLTNGGRYHPKVAARIIEDDYIKAYLIHPTQTWKEGPDDAGYTEQWQQVRTTVGNLVPKLQDQSRWTDIPYTVATPAEVLKSDGAAGKNLFKYDPAHDVGGGKTEHLAMLWIEDQKEPYHEDRW